VDDVFSNYSNKSPGRSLAATTTTAGGQASSPEISRISEIWKFAKEDLQAKTQRIRWLQCENAALVEQVAQLKKEASAKDWRLSNAERRCLALSSDLSKLREERADWSSSQAMHPNNLDVTPIATQPSESIGTYEHSEHDSTSVSSSSLQTSVSTSRTPSNAQRDHELLNVSIRTDHRSSTSTPTSQRRKSKRRSSRGRKTSTCEVLKNAGSSGATGWVVGEVSAIVNRFQAASGNRVPTSIEQRLVRELVAYVRKREDGARARIRSQVR
jgi:hypothetical protein